ncbi:peptide MFS transporter [Agrilactobacillus yilanensis]|uniref:Peptide MFS transporter n=1 Tax=Agrilactobacillus yilanensis TaxID=2485997 RepID=A0ABW4J967_9LACO|nr:peptide MFS transporter [Agrilactobacillus yilanensis]
MEGIFVEKKEKTFLGQPRGLSTLFMTEFWERFSYYGMKAILLFYMYYAVEKGGLGFNQVTAASIMAIYGSLVYLAGVIGGFIADRLLGSRRTVFMGGVLIMFGHIALALPFGASALYVSIVLIVLGTGLLKPNISEMVGTLYSPEDVRRDTGFSIFVLGINLGSLLAPAIVGTVGQKVNFHLGFSIAAIGMFFGLLQYYFGGRKYLSESSLHPTDPITPEERPKVIRNIVLIVAAFVVVFGGLAIAGSLNIGMIVNVFSAIGVALPIFYFILMLSSKKTTKVERSRIWAYIPLFFASVLFWSIEEQGSVILALFAANQTQLNLGWIELLPSWFQMLNPFFIIVYTPIFAIIWTKLGKRQPSTPAKFATGLIFAGLSYVLMVLPTTLNGQKLSNAMWLVLSWAIVIIAEMLISPIGLSATTKLAPKAFQSQMMSMWFLGDAMAQAINAQVVKLYSVHSAAMYFGVYGAIVVAFGVILFVGVPRIRNLMQGIK